MKQLFIKPLELFQLFVSVIILIIVNFQMSLRVSEFLLLLVFFECLVLSFNDEFFNIYQLLLIMFLFFNLSIPFCHVLGLYSYPSSNMLMESAMIRVPVTDETLVTTYKVMMIVLSGTAFGWLISLRNTSNQKDFFFQKRFFTVFDKSFKYLFYVSAIIELFYQLFLVSYSIENGYVETIHFHSKAGLVLKLFTIFNDLYPILGLWVLYQCTDRKDYIKQSVIFAFPFIIQLFTGYRGNFFCVSLSLLFVYSRFYKQITINQTIIAFIIMVVIIAGIGTYRWTRDVSDLFAVGEGGIFGLITNEFIKNSDSIIVLAYTIQLIDQFTNKVPFLLGYFFAIFSFAKNYSIAGILEKNYLAQHLTYILNPQKLLHGSTIGTNISAEFYEFAKGSYIIILLLSVLMLIVMGILLKRLYKNQLWFYFGMTYLQYFLISPRGSVMKIFNKVSFLYLFLFFIIKSLSKGTKYELK